VPVQRLELGDLPLVERREGADRARLVADVGLVERRGARQLRLGEQAGVAWRRRRRVVRVGGCQVDEKGRSPPPACRMNATALSVSTSVR
jgi:hypothetical protein